MELKEMTTQEVEGKYSQLMGNVIVGAPVHVLESCESAKNLPKDSK